MDMYYIVLSMISHLQDESCQRVIEKFSLLPLYSEANPVVSFLVHRGANMTGQLLKIVVSRVECFVHMCTHMYCSVLYACASTHLY